jgi:glucosamine kinase
MHLLAESGGTKTQWYLYDAQGLRQEFRTSGFNPNVQSAAEIEAQQRADWAADGLPNEPLTLDFYGAGLGSPTTEAIVHGILANLFPNATLNLRTDMLAAALATCGDEAGIVCILGTGSNCCFWDGQKITGNLGSHGYLFSDEGSGADLGRTIISAALNGELPHHLEHKFRDWAGKPFLEIRTEIYHSPKINAALAHYSRFLAAHLEDPTIKTMVIARFIAFLQRTVCRMKGYRETPLHFVGSVSEVYAAPLQEALAMLQLSATSVTAAPGEKLLDYHIAKLKGAAG